MATNPVLDFLKMARETKVRAHLRRSGGKTVLVSSHGRDLEDEKQSDEDAAEQERVRNLRARQAKEIQLWRTWKEGGEKKEDLKPLLKSFGPMIASKVNVYSGKVRIPPSAIEATFKIEFVKGLRSYDPEKGALGTYLYRYMDKGKRWITSNQNTGRIPENRIYKITEYKNAEQRLTEKLDRKPTTVELANKLGWTTAEVARMESELRAGLITQNFEDDPNQLEPSKEEEVLRLFKYELTGQQREVYDYLTGFGKPKLSSTGDIADKMGLKDYQVSRIKNQIQKKLKRHLEGI